MSEPTDLSPVEAAPARPKKLRSRRTEIITAVIVPAIVSVVVVVTATTSDPDAKPKPKPLVFVPPTGCENLNVHAFGGLPLTKHGPAIKCLPIDVKIANDSNVLSAGSDGVWFNGTSTVPPYCPGVFRLDPETLVRTATLCNVRADSMASDARNVWFLEITPEAIGTLGTNGFTIVDIDRVSGHVVSSRLLAVSEPHSSDSHPQIAAGPDALWLISPNDGMLFRISKTTGRVIASIPLADRPVELAVSKEHVWITADAQTGDGHAIAVDTATNKVTAMLRSPQLGPPDHIVAAGNDVWVGSLQLELINDHTQQIVSHYGKALISFASPGAGIFGARPWVVTSGQIDDGPAGLILHFPAGSSRPDTAMVLGVDPEIDTVAVHTPYLWAVHIEDSLPDLRPQLVRVSLR
jgi:hypothetical protein